MNKLFTLFLFILSLQSCENKSKNSDDSYQKNEKEEEWTKEKDREVAGSLYAKFDNDNLDDDFNIEKNEDELVQSFLSVFLSSQNKKIKFNLINNSVLYNNIESYYSTSFTITEKKVCIIRIGYNDQESVPNISGEKKDLIEKIKLRFNNQNQKIQVIGYELTYNKNSKFIKKSFNFITGKYIATRKSNEKTDSVDGWSAELQNIYAENWDFPFLRDKIFWYGEAVE
ncbi:hypothetical protein [Flavobacterium hungaricum]|uniref:Lipoprotein n=1 Tax=Flavobacterium hungaricum TaxID=2082725 RepID=A0ABR9TGA7_9FLAO|nr:hypothetical protein [Flavobacterium hungaricum]MBE8724069.1 hypothetical protein [Flavobacterium hungaricum]